MVRCYRCQRRLPPTGECAIHGRSTAVNEIAALAMPAISPPSGWALGDVIAQGGTAIVHEVRQGTAPPAVLKWGRWRDRDIHARFACEADVLRAVGAPATPTYIDHGAVGGWPYLIMELVTGETLAAWMARHGDRSGIGAIVALLTRFAAALAAVHAQGIVHRDLKPENMMIGPQGVRLIDFGLAKRLHDASSRRLTQVDAVVGTVHYLAPEQLNSLAQVDQRADLYAFGVVAFEMLVGQPPFIGERRAIEYGHRMSRPPSLRERRPISQELEDLVMACLAKTPDERPASADELRAALSRVLGSVGTLRGVGASDKPLGATDSVVLAWIDGGDPLGIARAITNVHGLIVRRQGDGLLAAFSALHHEAPLDTAVAICRDLARGSCRIVLHVTQALVRRSAEGKTTIYGEDIEQLARWVPSGPYTGLLLTAAVAASVRTRAADDAPGLFREVRRAHSHVGDDRVEPVLVGRAGLVGTLVAAATAVPPNLIVVSGEHGVGKTRVLAAVGDRLRAAGREVIVVHGRRAFAGDLPDDDRLIAALGGGGDLGDALAQAGARDAIVMLDDVHWFSEAIRATLVRGELGVACFVASPEALVLPTHGDDPRGLLAFEISHLPFADSELVLRDLLRPARRLPDVLVERLAMSARGIPGALVALATDIKRRGALRLDTRSGDWYVAADELEAMFSPSEPAWLVLRALEDLPVELAPVVRTCAALGARFAGDEVHAVTDGVDTLVRLAWLVRDGVLVERGGWYEFANTAMQDAIYMRVLHDHVHIHTRALAYWREHPLAGVAAWLARIAFHAAGAGEHAIAAAAWAALARAAGRRGQHAEVDDLLRRALAQLVASTPPELGEAIRALDNGSTDISVVAAR